MIYAATLGLLAMHGYLVVEKKFRNGLNLYPNDHIRLYMSILFELVSYYDKHNEDFSLEPLYQEVFQITPHSREDRINLKSIQENYGYYINKENKQ